MWPLDPLAQLGLSWHDLVEVQKEHREAQRVQEEHHCTLQQAIVVIVNVRLKKL